MFILKTKPAFANFGEAKGGKRMLREDFFDQLRKSTLIHFRETSSHSFDHTDRVYTNALRISEGEDVDMDVVRASARLHDIARHKEDIEEVDCHAIEGARMAEKILHQTEFPPEKIPAVVYAISVHRYSTNIKPETREAEILQDADRLDSLGAICITRVFAYGAMKNRPMHDPNIVFDIGGYGETPSPTSISHFYRKILKITPDTFKTRRAREIARDRYMVVQAFVDRFEKEWVGEL